MFLDSRYKARFRLFEALISSLLWLQVESVTYAALGDSYASGDGVGSSKLLPNLDLFCGRFSGAYPIQVANDTQAGISRFRNLACGGAVTTSVLRTQVPFVGNSDLITIQVGGNEIDFFLLLNECIYQWRPISNCEAELIRARQLVQSKGFLDHFDALISKTGNTIHETATLMVLGYARFFNDGTDQCDSISFSHTDSQNFLTKSIRKQLNNLVLLLNDVIKAIADTHSAFYIDVDRLFEGHRFCEQTAVEPSNSLSWFYTDDTDEEEFDIRGNSLPVSQYILPNPFRGFLDFARTFHPTWNGHAAIAREVVRATMARRAS